MVQKRSVSPAIIVWLFIGTVANAVAVLGDAPWEGKLLLACAGLIHCLIGFWSDGRQRITAPGIYLFASGLFIFFPGIYLSFDDPITHGPAAMMTALNVSFFSQIIIYYLWWKPRPQDEAAAVPSASAQVTAWGTWWGLVLVVFGVGAAIAGIGGYALYSSAAFVGAVLLATALFRKEKSISLIAYGLVAAAFFAYTEFVFTGFGRLQIGAMGLAIAMVAAHRWRGRTVKAALLVAVAPTLAILGQSRIELTAATSPESTATGIGSVIGPFIRFAELLHLDAEGLLNHTYGYSFFSSAVALVPREIWPEKPVGFGAALAHLFRPELDGSGHSELALFAGEWLFSFGVAGLVIMVPIVGYVVARLDRIVLSVQSVRIVERRDLLLIVAVVLLGSSLVDLLWGGTFTYVSRVGPRLLVVFALFVFFAWRRRNPHRYQIDEGSHLTPYAQKRRLRRRPVAMRL